MSDVKYWKVALLSIAFLGLNFLIRPGAQATVLQVHLRASGSTHLSSPLIKVRASGGSATGGGWSNGYTYRRTIAASTSLISTVNNTALSNFPMLVSSTLSDMKTVGNGGNVQNLNGYDIIFTSDAAGASKLNWEMEKYTSSTGEMDAWVQVPTLSSSTNNTIYMFYGKAGVSSFQSNATATWDGNFQGVWHLGQTTSTILDSTGNMNNGVASTTPTSTIIDGGQATQQSPSTFVTIPSSTSLTNTGASPMTISGWVTVSDQSWSKVVLADKSKDATNGWDFDAADGGNRIFFSLSKTGSDMDVEGASLLTSNNTWYYVAATWNGDITVTSSISLYVNGIKSSINNSGLGVGTLSSDADNPLILGAQFGGSLGYNGGMDEVEFSNTVRSDDWISTAYNNQNNPSAFLSIGSATALPPSQSLVRFR